jgi:hypothetical protein
MILFPVLPELSGFIRAAESHKAYVAIHVRHVLLGIISKRQLIQQSSEKSATKNGTCDTNAGVKTSKAEHLIKILPVHKCRQE